MSDDRRQMTAESTVNLLSSDERLSDDRRSTVRVRKIGKDIIGTRVEKLTSSRLSKEEMTLSDLRNRRWALGRPGTLREYILSFPMPSDRK